MPFTNRFDALPLYLLATIPQKKRDLIARGVDVIDLGAGDADLAAPPAAIAALKAAVDDPGMSRYGFGLGLPAFRDSVASWMQKRFGHRFDPLKEIVPLIGSKEGIAHLCFAYLQKGDVAIIPDPGYLAYLGGTLLGEAEPYLYPITPRTNFLVDLDEIPEDVLRRTKLLFLNYPNNPTAAIAPVEYLEKVVRICKERGIILVYDNAYSEMTFDGYVAPSIFEIEGARDVAVEYFSLSKSFQMTGWRLGFVVGRSELITALTKVKSDVDTGPFLALQAAGAWTLDHAEELVKPIVAELQVRRDAAVAALREQGFEVEVPIAAMYVWIPLPAGIASADFSTRALEEEGVVTMAGSGFGPGGEGFFRIALTQPAERIREAVLRLGRTLAACRDAVAVAQG